MEPILSSVNCAAQTLGLGRTKIYELINAGKLEAVKIGRRRLIKTASIQRLIDTAS